MNFQEKTSNEQEDSGTNCVHDLWNPLPWRFLRKDFSSKAYSASMQGGWTRCDP